MKPPARAWTEEEVRAKVLDHVAAMTRYWENESRAPTTREKLEGLAHSMLVMLDGGAMGVPKFTVTPDPHPSDRQFHIDEGANYFPEKDCDIAGPLHEDWGKRR